MIVLTDVVCYGWIIVLIGRGSVGGSCDISIRDLFCFPSVVCLPVSPMYTFSNWLHGILYTTPAFFCLSTLSFGWTKTCPRVVWGLTTAAILCLVNVRCMFSVNEWTYGTVTTPRDFSCVLSFLGFSFLIAFFLSASLRRFFSWLCLRTFEYR